MRSPPPERTLRAILILSYHYACAMSTSDLHVAPQPAASPLANAQAVPRSVCLIVNPAAGGGRAGRAAPGVVDALRGHGLTVRREDTRDLDHARELALGAAR